MKWLAIANPAAGRAQEADRLIERLHRLRTVDADIVRTREPGHATRLAQDAAGYDGVIAIGGDGTIAEVLRGLRLERQCLAVLPAGHGNCLARDLGVAEPDRALAALGRGKCRPLDLMRVEIGLERGGTECRLCASTLAMGYVTDVVEFGRRRLPGLGRAAYAAAAMAVIPREFEAFVAGGESPRLPQRYTGLVINNTMHLANFRGFPDASVRDGMLDVMELGHCWSRQMLHNLAVLAGRRVPGPRRMRQERSERVELVSPQTLMADGELLQRVVRVDVECQPAAAMCLVGTA
jgi:diacylglycerol kinase (ATP)